jgi:hypothetical protein
MTIRTLGLLAGSAAQTVAASKQLLNRRLNLMVLFLLKHPTSDCDLRLAHSPQVSSPEPAFWGFLKRIQRNQGLLFH